MREELRALLDATAELAPAPSSDLVPGALRRRKAYLRRRVSRRVAGIAAASAVIAGTVAILGMAGDGPENSPAVDEPQPAVSTPTWPPCPSVSEVERMKESGSPVRPCDPLLEAPGPESTSSGAPEPSGNGVCPGVSAGKASGLIISLPCAVGAAITTVREVQVAGEWCARVTYVSGTGAKPITETLCAGDRPSAGGPTVTVQ